MGGEGSGRKPDPVKALLNPKLQPIAKGTGTGVAGNFILPNYGAAKGAAATPLLDATYLRLDAANDPMTGDLDLNSNNIVMDEGYISFDESASTMRIQGINSETLKFTSQKIMQFEAMQFECNPTGGQNVDWYFIGDENTGIMSWINDFDYFFWADDQRIQTNEEYQFGTYAHSSIQYDDTDMLVVPDKLASGAVLKVSGASVVTSDSTVLGEVLGSKVLMQCGYYATMSSVGTNYFMKMPDFVQMSLTKGFVPSRPGSITGIGIIYDVVVSTNAPTITLRVYKNGSIVWQNTLSNAVANDKKNNFTQARGTDTFIAGDVISVSIIAEGKSAAISMNDVGVNVEMIYDE